MHYGVEKTNQEESILITKFITPQLMKLVMQQGEGEDEVRRDEEKEEKDLIRPSHMARQGRSNDLMKMPSQRVKKPRTIAEMFFYILEGQGMIMSKLAILEESVDRIEMNMNIEYIYEEYLHINDADHTVGTSIPPADHDLSLSFFD